MNRRSNKYRNCGCDDPCSTYQHREICGCKTLLSANCVVYQRNKDLDNINTSEGDRLEYILIEIDEAIGKIYDQIYYGGMIENVGNGIGIYKGQDEDSFIEMLKSLISDDSIIIKSLENEIRFSISTEWLDNYLIGKLDLTPIINRIESVENRVTNIENNCCDDAPVTNSDVFSIEEVGNSIINIPDLKEVIQVSYCGAVLPEGGYSVNNNRVFLNLSNYGLVIENEDIVRVIYKKN